VVLVSSGAVYGAAEARRPLGEQDATVPVTYYAVLKQAQEQLAASYVRRGALHVVTVRPFNLVGPGEDGTLVTGAAALQIARGERRGVGFEIRTGQLDAYRDFIDVRDAARAFVLAAQVGEAGEVFNVCGGRAVQVREAVGVLSRAARAPVTIVERVEDRGPDIPYQVGSARRLQERAGWEPRYSLEQSLLDLLDDARERVAADGA
jgi:GDP-4-dehydro-6-deoxy-D-mannose reductase